MTRPTISSIRHWSKRHFAAGTRLPDRLVWPLLGGLFVIAGLAVVLAPAQASLIEDAVVGAIGFICETLVSFLGQILLLVVGVLMNIAQYNKFVTAPAVGTGWVIVRDVVNMFFIVVLLVLAFGTILGVQTYSIKGGNLTRLLIMAIVINFSRTLCGLMIDFGQVVMLTFVSGFKDAAGGNFVEAMKINEVLQNATGGEDVNTAAIVISLILALVMTAIATFVVIMMTIALLIRIVYLWLLIILSPIAFFLKAVPGGQASKAYADWWSKFTSNVIVGPVLAFFLWLSLVTVQQGNIAEGFPTGSTGESISDSVGQAFNSDSIQTFMIAVCLLLGGYQIAQEIGGSTMGMASKIKQGATGAAKWAGKQAMKRSGMDAYLAQRRAAKEETYKARGAKIAGGVGTVQLAAGKVLSAPGGVIGKGIGAAGRRLGVRKMEGGKMEEAKGVRGWMARRLQAAGGAVEKRGVTGAIGAGVAGAPGAAIKGLGKGLERLAGEAKEGEGAIKRGIRKVGRGAGRGVAAVGGAAEAVGKGVGGFPGYVVEGGIATRAGRQSQKVARDHSFNETMREKTASANLKKDEVLQRAQGKLAGQTNAEQRGAILQAMDKKFVTEKDLDNLRTQFEAAGADKASMAAFDDTAKKNFPSWKTFAAAGEAEEFQNVVDRGGLDLKGAKPETVVANAEAILKSPFPARIPYEKQIASDPAQKEAYTKRLKEVADKPLPPEPKEPPEEAPQEAKDQFKADLATFTAAQRMQQDARESILRVDPREAGLKAFGADSKTGTVAEAASFTKAMQAPKAGATALMMDASAIADAKGELTELGKAMAAGLSVGELDNMVRNQEGANQEKLVRAVVEGIKQLKKGDLKDDKGNVIDDRIAQLQSHIENSRVIKDRLPASAGGGGGGEKKEVKIEVTGGGGGGSRKESAPVEVAMSEAQIGELTKQIDQLKSQRQADAAKGATKQQLNALDEKIGGLEDRLPKKRAT